MPTAAFPSTLLKEVCAQTAIATSCVSSAARNRGTRIAFGYFRIAVSTFYFGPHASPRKEWNWVPTKEGENFEIPFHFYGPEKPLLDQTWKLPNIEQTK